MRTDNYINSTYQQNNTKWVKERCKHHSDAADASDAVSAIIMWWEISGNHKPFIKKKGIEQIL